MRLFRFQFVGWTLTLLAAAGLVLPAAAQRGRGRQQRQEHRPARAEQRERNKENRPPKPDNPDANAPAGNRGDAQRILPGDRGTRPGRGVPPPWMERLREMSPEQQRRFLDNNARFRNLPAERQEQIRRRLDEWNRLAPQQREEVRDREHIWRQMSPEQQDHIRNEVLPRWRQMPQDRRQAIQRRLRALRDLPESAREQRLNDPEFMKGLAPEDQSLLRDLSRLRFGAATEPPASEPPENP